MGVITVNAGFFIMLVASSLPPSPVSRITTSAGTLANARKAAAVVISKNVIGLPAFASLAG